MSTKSTIKWIFLLLLLGAMVAGLTLYLLASHVPGDYHPVTVPSQLKREKMANLEDKVLREFIGPAGAISSQRDGQAVDPAQSFVMKVGQDELNEWVGSLPDEALTWLAGFGLKDPAIAINNGRVTFYIYWAKYKKVLGLDVAPTIRPDGMLVIELQSVRMGNLAMPQSWVEENLQKLFKDMQARLAKEQRQSANSEDPAAATGKNIRKAASAILQAASGTPVDPSIRESWGNVRLSRILVEREQASVEVVPLVEGESGLIDKMSQLRAHPDN